MKHDTMYTDLSHDKPNHDIYKSPYMVVTLNLPYAYIKNKIHIYKRGRSRVTRYSILQSYILCREVFCKQTGRGNKKVLSENDNSFNSQKELNEVYHDYL